MSKSCEKCNYANDDQNDLCQQCGAPLTQPAVQETTQASSMESPPPVPPAAAAPPAPPKAAVQQAAAAAQPQASPAKKCTEQQLSMDQNSQPVSVGTYFIMLLLFSIPFINIIMMIIWAVGSKNKSKQNFAIAALIWFILAIILCFIGSLVIVFVLSLSATMLDGREQDVFQFLKSWQQMIK